MTTISRCRACGHGDLDLVLSLGETPLANALLGEADLGGLEETFPLDLVFCPRCSLAQITETVAPEKLFGHYLYFSSFADAVVENARRIAERLAGSRGWGEDSLVLEIASNDGYLLKNYQAHGIPVLGVEPASNIAEAATSQGIPTLNDFFGPEAAETLRAENRLADVIHANNVLAHVADLNGVVAGFQRVLKPDGVVVIEVPYVRDLVEKREFDTIYHEHLCYFSVTALHHLFDRHGLELCDVEKIEIHGGSLRLFVRHRRCNDRQWWRLDDDDRVHEMLRSESALGMDGPGFFRDFGTHVGELRSELVRLLRELKNAGHSLAVYGASAKGSTLLNYFGIGGEIFDFVADRSTEKQGLFTPGTRLPIVDPAALVAEQPDYVLLLTWNFADEILAQQDEYRRRGGKFIIPIPEIRVV